MSRGSSQRWQGQPSVIWWMRADWVGLRPPSQLRYTVSSGRGVSTAIRLEPTELATLAAGTEPCAEGCSTKGQGEHAGEKQRTKTKLSRVETRAWQCSARGLPGLAAEWVCLVAGCNCFTRSVSPVPEDPGVSFCLCDGSRPIFRGSPMSYGRGAQNFSLILHIRILKSQVLSCVL